MKETFTPLPDAQARRAAVETLDRPVIVEAGAGTGKTTLLVERVLHALARDAARMPGVVAITFTEKAAAELRLRLRQELEARLALEDTPPETRARWTRALIEFDRAQVSTIHAFASNLIRAQHIEAGIDAQFRIMDEVESAQVQRAFWRQWVDTHVDDAATETALRAALLAGAQIEPDLAALVRELDAQRDLVPDAWPAPARDLAGDIHEFVAAAAATIAHAERHCREPADRGFEALRALGEVLEWVHRLPEESRPGAFLQRLRIARSAGRVANWEPGKCAESKAMRQALDDRLGALRQTISNSILHGVMTWLGRFAADYAAEKRRRAVLDFQDLLLYAQRLLRDHPAARRTFASGIDLLCVDEFQDTDPLQAEIVWFLAEAEGSASRWEDVVVGPKLFLVGDPKQSIYRFRRADLEMYARCAERVVACGGLRLDIVHNFRSRPAILDWVNGVFETLFDTGEPRHVALVGTPDRLRTPAVWRVQPAVAADAATAQRRAEAGALVAWVARALADGWPVRDRGGERPMQPRDVAMLFARTSGVEIFEDALRAAGLPFQQEGGRLFFERQEVRDVLQALAAIDDPHDELALVATLRSPLFGASDEDLWLHRIRHGGFGDLEAAAETRLGDALATLAALHAERHAAGIAGTIVSLLDRTGARAFHATQPAAAQALANLEMLQRHARQFETGRGGGLREFVRALREFPTDAPRMAEWAPQDEDENRIRLLTVHMAKGLEFPCVALANLGARANSRSAAVIADRVSGRFEVRFRPADATEPIATAGHHAASRLDAERDGAEERRLLYVAATRARDYLVVPDPLPQSQGFGRLLRLAPAALGGAGPLGEFVRAGSDVPAAARACVVEAAALPVRVRRPGPPGTVRADLALATRARDRWAAEHAARLLAGGAVSVEPVPRPDSAADPWPWRAWLARALELAAAGEAIEPAAHRVARVHGATGRAVALAALAVRAHAFAVRAESARARYGVRIATTHGGTWTDCWVDLVQSVRGGLRVVVWVIGGEAAPHGLDAALAALARSSVEPVVESGTFDLEAGKFTPLGG